MSFCGMELELPAKQRLEREQQQCDELKREIADRARTRSALSDSEAELVRVERVQGAHILHEFFCHSHGKIEGF